MDKNIEQFKNFLVELESVYTQSALVEAANRAFSAIYENGGTELEAPFEHEPEFYAPHSVKCVLCGEDCTTDGAAFDDMPSAVKVDGEWVCDNCRDGLGPDVPSAIERLKVEGQI